MPHLIIFICSRMRASLCSLLLLLVLSLAASLPVEGEEGPVEGEEELYEDEAVLDEEEEEVEYGFQPIGDLPETGSVPVIETDEEKPLTRQRSRVKTTLSPSARV